MSHTKEPWSTDADSGYPLDVHGGDGMLVARCHEESDARRIVACMNACSGIKTEDLERYGDTTAPVFELLMDTTKQRDELLAAFINARNALESANEMGDGPICDTIWYGPAETLFDYMDSVIFGMEADK